MYTDASRDATGMADVLAIMIVRSIKLRPVRGSVSDGKSRSVSTISPALSPHAAMMTISISACLAVICCNTVLPAPKGPGMQYVPPRAIGNIESTIRTRVTRGSSGKRRLREILSGRLTGQCCCMVAACSFPVESVNRAICLSTVYGVCRHDLADGKSSSPAKRDHHLMCKYTFHHCSQSVSGFD